MYRSLSFLLFALFLFAGSSANAQLNKDFGHWYTLGFGKDINERWDVSVYQELRTENNGTSIGRTFTQFAVDYEVQRWFRLGLNYRFILNKRSDESFGHRHRIMGDVQFRKYHQRWRFIYRNRTQWEVRTWNYTREYGYSPAWDNRNTIKVDYRINRKYRAFCSFDLRFLLRDARTPEVTDIDRTRFVSGVDIDLPGYRRLSLFVLLSRHWNIPEPDQIFVVGAEFSFGSARPAIMN